MNRATRDKFASGTDQTNLTGGNERFWSKVDLSGECWLWLASKNPKGYGLVRHGGRIQRAHRVAFELAGGVIPDGYEIDHLCRVRACVRPSHLEAVTRDENMARVSASITHCVNGHEFNEATTYVRPNGCRDCRKCRMDRKRRWKKRKREQRDTGQVC